MIDAIGRFLVYAFTPYNFVTNISAEVVQVAAVFGVWKAARRWLAPRMHLVVHRVLAPHLDAHTAVLKAHITAELERLR